MEMQVIAIHENQFSPVYKYDITEDIQVFVSDDTRIISVFYGDIDFEVRNNAFVASQINKLRNATDETERIFILQVLERLALENECVYA